MDREMRLATDVCMFGHQCKCPLCVVCSGGGVGRCRSGMSEYVCMYWKIQMSCGIQLSLCTSCSVSISCVCVGGGGGDD